MANEQTLTFDVDIPVVDGSGLEQVRKCTLTLSTEDMTRISEGGEEPGGVTIQGAVMPVGSTDPGLNSKAA